MKVYISGPMTGIDQFNMPAFNSAASRIAALGHDPVLPVGFQDGKQYHEYLRDDIALLMTCDAIYMLSGWRDSNGARLENYVARKCSIKDITGEI